MKKLSLWMFLALLAYQPALGADTKLADLTATTTPAITDILYIVVDPSGTPLDRKVTVGNLAKGLGAVGVVTVTQPATAATLTIINNKTLTVNKTLTLDGTDGTTMTFPATSATIARTDAANTFTGAQTIGAGLVGAPSLLFSNDADSGIYSRAASRTTFTSDGVARFEIGPGYLQSASAYAIGSAVGAANDIGFGRVAAGVGRVEDGSGNLRWLNTAGSARVATQFDKTTSTTLADVTGFTMPLLSGRTYTFSFLLYIAADVTGSAKLAVAYSSTTSAIKYNAVCINDATGTPFATTLQTTSGGAISLAAGATAITCQITGGLTTTGAGNLTLQFAQAVSNGTSSVLTASYGWAIDTP